MRRCADGGGGGGGGEWRLFWRSRCTGSPAGPCSMGRGRGKRYGLLRPGPSPFPSCVMGTSRRAPSPCFLPGRLVYRCVPHGGLVFRREGAVLLVLSITVGYSFGTSPEVSPEASPGLWEVCGTVGNGGAPVVWCAWSAGGSVVLLPRGGGGHLDGTRVGCFRGWQKRIHPNPHKLALRVGNGTRLGGSCGSRSRWA